MFSLHAVSWFILVYCASVSRGGVSGGVASCAGGGSHNSSAVDRVCVAVEEQVSKPYSRSFTSGDKACKNANEADIVAGGLTEWYCTGIVMCYTTALIGCH